MKTRRRRPQLWASERLAKALGFQFVAGVDEVGLGPLAGPAVAAAVVLPMQARLRGLDDSKALTHEQRVRLDRQIRRQAVALGLHEISPRVIDEQGLHRARQLAMAGAVQALGVPVEYLLIDAWDVPDLLLPQLAMIKGDALCASIMAASIVAKVHRDRMMVDYDRQFPGYGFAEHKGYATAEHRAALRRLGPSPIHRMTWRPIRALQAEPI